MKALIRPAVETDAARILDIYKPYVEDTSITFEYTVPELDHIKQRIKAVSEIYPWLVLEVDGKVEGYAYANKFRDRQAYNWCAESSIYLSAQAVGKGYGFILYQCLIDLLKEQGFFEVLAVITWPNEQSEAFHKKNGFVSCGIIKKAGNKFEKWHDILIMQKELKDAEAIVTPVIPLIKLESAFSTIEGWNLKIF